MVASFLDDDGRFFPRLFLFSLDMAPAGGLRPLGADVAIEKKSGDFIFSNPADSIFKYGG